jgi:hypothetical protein
MQLKSDIRFPQTDPRHHTGAIKAMLDEIITHVREDVDKVDEPQAKAIFEMTAEVLLGVKKTYEDYEKKEERAFSQSDG